jgi:PBP1b-binding outer membrane lipoprotein LpoB
MIKTKIMRSILLIMSVFLITSCSNKSAMKPEDFKNKEPRLIIEEYLSGNVKAWGVCKIDLVKLLDSFQLI